MLAFVCRDVRNGSEYIAGVGRRTLDAVSVVDSSLSSFGINIKVLKIVVEIDGTGTEVSSKQSCMCREDGGYIYATSLTQGKSNTG